MSAIPKDKLVEEVLSLADRLFRQLFPTVPKDLLTMDVTMPQIKIMFILYIHGPSRMSDLASELDVTLPTATNLVDRLVDKNYVSRENQTADRRVVLCRLTEAGQKAIGRIWESSRLRSQALLEEMDSSKLEMFIEVLEDMLKSAEAGNRTGKLENKLKV
jgi:MarR family transcriptional regulator, organic hydroperoxide resistance regulator